MYYQVPTQQSWKFLLLSRGEFPCKKKKYMKNIKDIPKQSKSFSVAIFHPNLWSIYVESSRILRNSDWFRLQKCYVVPIVLFPVSLFTQVSFEGEKKSMWSIWRITSCDNTEDSKLSTKNIFPIWVLHFRPGRLTDEYTVPNCRTRKQYGTFTLELPNVEAVIIRYFC